MLERLGVLALSVKSRMNLGTLITVPLVTGPYPMNLRLKTLLASSIATMVLLMGLSVGLSYLVLRQIAQMETNTMNRRLDRTIASLPNDLGVLPDADRSSSPDRKSSQEQVRSNVDVAIVLDRNGKPVVRDLKNPALRAAQLPSPSLQAQLANLPARWVSLPTTDPLNLPNGVQVGFLHTSEGLLLLSERPLEQNNGEQPLRLLTGQWLRPQRLKMLGEVTLLRLRLLSVEAPEVPAQLRDSQLGTLRAIEDYIPKPDSQPEIRPENRPADPQPANSNQRDALQSNADRDRLPSPQISKSQVKTEKNLFPKGATKFQVGYILLRDVKGEPIAVLQAISPKPFVAQGEEGVKILLLFLWVTVPIFGLVLNLLLDRWVLARISNLSRQLKEVKADFTHSTSVTLAGRDELSDLAADINVMLEQQEQYQQSLHLAKAEIEAASKELEHLACTDGLTQVMNRRFFQINLEKVWQTALQNSQSLSLLLCDVDFFKPYNDIYGHLAGDLCLQKVAKAMSVVVEDEPTAIVARYGGEEFAVILPSAPVRDAIAIAEQMRISVLHLNIPHSGSKVTDYVTLSIGVCSLIPQLHLSQRDLIARADEHLYQAKNEGRNRVVAALPAIANPQTDAGAKLGAH